MDLERIASVIGLGTIYNCSRRVPYNPCTFYADVEFGICEDELLLELTDGNLDKRCSVEPRKIHIVRNSMHNVLSRDNRRFVQSAVVLVSKQPSELFRRQRFSLSSISRSYVRSFASCAALTAPILPNECAKPFLRDARRDHVSAW